MAAAKKKPPAKKPAPKKPAAKKPAAKRDDLGAPIDGYLGKLGASQRAIADALVALVKAGAPAAKAELKWGMPVFSLPTGILGYLRGTKEYVRFEVNVGGTRQIAKLASVADLDGKQITAWLKAALKHH